MGDSEDVEPPGDDDVILKMTEHTRAKHRILEEYLKGWFPIMWSFDKRIIYLDGFAGSGEYDDGSYGSPFIAIETAKNNPQATRSKEVVFYFVEKNHKRYAHLLEKIDHDYKLSGTTSGGFQYHLLPSEWGIRIIEGEFNSNFKKELELLDKDGARLAPTMAFVDPYGYSAIDIDHLGKILRFPKCELLITYMVSFVDRFAFDPSHNKVIKDTLKIDQNTLDEICGESDKEKRELRWLKLLNDGIERAASPVPPGQRIHRLSFKLMDKNNNTLYYLVYFTKSIRGMEVMKRAMFAVSKSYEYTFSDHNFDPNQLSMFDFAKGDEWEAHAAEALLEKFAGKISKVQPLKEFIVFETMWQWRAGILDILEKRGDISVDRGKARKGSYPDGTIIRFRA